MGPCRTPKILTTTYGWIPEEFQPGPHDEYAVYGPAGQLIGNSQNVDAVALGAREGLRTVHVGDHSYRVLQRHALRIIDRAETGGEGRRRPVTIVYAVSTDRLWHQVFEATRFYLFLCIATAALTAVMLVLLARRLLVPLHELASSAEAIKPESLAFEAPPSALETQELRPLANALQEMISRVRSAFEAEKRFFNDGAHELKTAAAVVRSSVQVIDLKPRSVDEYRAGLERVLQDSERLEELIAQMLSLAHYEGSAASAERQVDLGEQARLATEALSTFAESRGVRIALTREANPKVRLTADAAQTLIRNLLMNATQHSFAGGEVSLRVSASGRREDAILLVQDTGTGIAPESLPHVFERFYREDTSRSRETGGAGLGLSICKSIVDAAGGSIHIESAPGRGTQIAVQLKKVEGVA